jgi:hypothetical protein
MMTRCEPAEIAKVGREMTEKPVVDANAVLLIGHNDERDDHAGKLRHKGI